MRISRDEWGLRLATATALRATCRRRAVGCVLVDVRGRVLATGYNGVARGQPHCTELPCPAAGAASGTQLDGCYAIHAEQNALLQCRIVDDIHTCYCTTSPCVTCTKLLMNTGCRRVVFRNEYPQPEAQHLWLGATAITGREWVLLVG